MHPEQKIVLIGTGKLAGILGNALHQAGFRIVQVYGRNLEKAVRLASGLNSKAVSSFNELVKDADLYIIAVSDDAIYQMSRALLGVSGICVHTSGTVHMDVFQDVTSNFGVFYPLQTFSEGRRIILQEVPFLIEGSNPNTTSRLIEIAGSISDKVFRCDSEERKTIHLSAVFVNNFVNAMLGIGEELITQTSLAFEILHPLVKETVAKALENGAIKSQTGPAIRGDKQTMDAHIHLFENRPDLASLYQQISAIIVKGNT